MKPSDSFRFDLILTLLVCVLSVLLDPPANLTVSSTDQQGQLRVSWRPPPLKYIKGNMMYEVSYAPVGGHVGKVCNTAFATHPASGTSHNVLQQKVSGLLEN